MLKASSLQLLVDRWRRRHTDLFVLALYVLMTALVRYPILFHFGSRLIGGEGYYVWLSWWRKFSWLNGLDFYFQSYNQAPFGEDLITPGFSGLTIVLGLLSMFLGEIATYNVMIFLSFVLSGMLAYMLARRLDFSRPVGFVAGAVFAFSRFALVNSYYDIDTVQQWVFPLFVLALLNLQRKQTPAAAIWLGGAFALAGYMHPYFAYYVAVVALVFVGVEVGLIVRDKGWKAVLDYRRWGLYTLAAGIGILMYMPDLYPTLRVLSGQIQSPIQADDVLRQPTEQFFYWSTRPWEYLLPPTDHFLWGALSDPIYTWIKGLPYLDHTPPILERLFPYLHTRWYWMSSDRHMGRVYLGWLNLIIAGYALWKWRKEPTTRKAAATNRRFGIVFSAVLFIVGLLFSQPPYLPIGAVLRHLWEPLFNVVIPTPSLLTLTLAPPLRHVLRFIILMMLALGLLVAHGLEQLISRFSKPAMRLGLVAVFVVLVALDYGYCPPASRSLTPPEEYARLASESHETIIVLYPFPSRLAAENQYVHELRLANPIARPATPSDNIAYIEDMAIGSLAISDIGSKLAALGVRYVVNSGATLESPPEGLSLAFATDTAQVFEVAADPASLVVLYTLRDGLWMSGNAWSWQSQEHTVYVWNPFSEPAVVDIEFTLDRPADGRELSATRVLTPHPERIIRWAMWIDNPNIPPDYPPESIPAEDTPDGVAFRSMLIQPGETLLNLRWSGEGDYPAVTDVHFTVVEPVVEE